MPVLFQEIEEDNNDHHHRRRSEKDVSPDRQIWWWKRDRARKLFYIFLKCILMGLMFSLFALFAVIALFVLIYIALTAVAGRRRRQSNRFFQENPSPELVRDSTTPRSYSREDLQQLLPPLSYVESPHTSRDCAICLESLGDGDFCRKLPGCKHLFHVNCIDNWLTKVPTCPICRNQVQLDYPASSSVDCDDEWKVWFPASIDEEDV